MDMNVMPTEDLTQLCRNAWNAILELKNEIGEPDLTVISLDEFQQRINEGQFALSLESQKLILRQAKTLINGVYAHAPFKDLQPTLDALADLEKGLDLGDFSQLDFHDYLSNAFLKLDDAHTLYGRPAPFRDSFAFLPFQVKHFFGRDRKPHYVVTRVMPAFNHPHFKPGVEITGWSEAVTAGELLPMAEVVERSSRIEVGPNPAAAHAFGLRRLFLRLLTYKPSPGLSVVKVQYIDRSRSNLREILVEWAVASGSSPSIVLNAKGNSCADVMAREGRASMILYKPAKAKHEYYCHQQSIKKALLGLESNPDANQEEPPVEEWESNFPQIFEIQFPGGPAKDDPIHPDKLILRRDPTRKFGYIRIKNFDLHHSGPFGREDQIAAEFQRILEIQMKHAPDGLILDIRGNPGGNVRAAEALLQMLTPKEITPAGFHWIRNDTIRKTLDALREMGLQDRKGTLDPSQQSIFGLLDPQFGRWLKDLENWEADELTEQTKRLSHGRQWSDKKQINSIGQVYQGPVVLLIDGFTYSAADIFSGGFQDHQIGPVLGLDQSTGGGGAIVKQHSEIVPFAEISGLDLQALPKDVTLSVAVLRSARVDGSFIEGVGVSTDKQLQRFRKDVLQGNPGVLAKACEILSRRPAYRLKIEDVQTTNTGIELKVSQSGVSTLEVFLIFLDGEEGERVEASIDENGLLQISTIFASVVKQILVRGLDPTGKLVAMTKKNLEQV